MRLKFLADVNVERPIVDWLAEKGYDIKWIPDIDCQMRDDVLLDMAKIEERILITNDKDFGELTFLQKKGSAGIILLRIKRQHVKDKLSILRELLQNYSNKLPHHFITVTKKKIRFLPMEAIK